MAKLSIEVSGVRPSAELVYHLGQLLRPFSLEGAMKAQEQIDAGISPFPVESFQPHVQSIIDSGGKFSLWSYALVDRDGVTHESTPMETLSDTPPNPKAFGDLLDYAVSLRMKLQTLEATPTTTVSFVGAVSHNRAQINIEAPAERIKALGADVRGVLDSLVDLTLLPPPRVFKVFIGHGGDGQWQYLERTLKGAGFEVENFEADDRSGIHSLVVIEELIRASNVAVIVMTGEDKMLDGSLRARENVVHEVGFAQGILGITNTVILLQEDVSEPSNIKGLTQIRFPPGRLIDIEEKILKALTKRRESYEYRGI